MSTFTGDVDGTPVEVQCYDGVVRFFCPMLGKTYDSYTEVERAIKAKLLALRKDFTNTTAVLSSQWSKSPQMVTVTALDGDDYAWVKSAAGKRSKERREYLFADRHAVEVCIQNEKSRNEQTRLEWEQLERWRPLK